MAAGPRLPAQLLIVALNDHHCSTEITFSFLRGENRAFDSEVERLTRPASSANYAQLVSWRAAERAFGEDLPELLLAAFMLIGKHTSPNTHFPPRHRSRRMPSPPAGALQPAPTRLCPNCDAMPGCLLGAGHRHWLRAIDGC
jgi:hypothetical protein